MAIDFSEAGVEVQEADGYEEINEDIGAFLKASIEKISARDGRNDPELKAKILEQLGEQFKQAMESAQRPWEKVAKDDCP